MKAWCSYEYIISYIFSALLPDNVKHRIRMVLLSLSYIQREIMAIRYFRAQLYDLYVAIFIQ